MFLDLSLVHVNKKRLKLRIVHNTDKSRFHFLAQPYLELPTLFCSLALLFFLCVLYTNCCCNDQLILSSLALLRQMTTMENAIHLNHVSWRVMPYFITLDMEHETDCENTYYCLHVLHFLSLFERVCTPFEKPSALNVVLS